MNAVRIPLRSAVALVAAVTLMLVIALMSFTASTAVNHASSTWSAKPKASSTWSKHAPTIVASSTWSKTKPASLSSTWS